MHYQGVIDKVTTITKQVTDAIHAIILRKYQKYPSNKIFIHAIFLAEVNKSPLGRLHNMTPHEAYRNTIHVHTMTLAGIIPKQNK